MRVIIKYLLHLFLIIQSIVFAQVDWEWQTPKPQGNRLVKILHLSSNKVITSGDVGTVLITEDNGVNWDLQKMPGHSNIRGISFLNANDGWLINKGKIFKTNDGGYSWEENEPYIDENSPLLKDIRYLNNNDGWLLTDCGNQRYYEDPVNSSGILYKTMDGGNTWQPIPMDVNSQFLDLQYVDSSTVIFNIQETSGLFIMKSLDGGNSWEKLHAPLLINADFDAVFFKSVDLGWYGRYKTTNGGQSWVLANTSIPSENSIESIYFHNEYIGWMTVRYDVYIPETGTWTFRWKIIHSIDGGITWTLQKDNIHEKLYDISFLNGKIGWICGDRGAIYNTENGGNEWVRITQGTPLILKDIDFVDDKNGWAVGSFGIIIHTDDAGATWQIQDTPTEMNLWSVDFVDQDKGWAVGQGTALTTFNGGKTWESRFSDMSEFYRDVQFPDPMNGWIVGHNGLILRTKDGGYLWEYQNSKTNQKLAGVYFVDKDYGWACGFLGTMLATTDGGLNWQEQSIPTPGFLRSLQFVDRNTGWCSSEDEADFLKTNDGGISWFQVPHDNYLNDVKGIQSFHFIDKSNGWAGGFLGGDIAKTTDGGWTWHYQERLLANGIAAIQFQNSGLGWCISGNSILKFTGDSTTIPEPKPSRPMVGLFPNPFNKSTTIYFRLSSDQNVIIEAYDTLGRRIATLYNGHASSDMNLVSWETDDLANGMYIIRFSSRDYIKSLRAFIIQ